VNDATGCFEDALAQAATGDTLIFSNDPTAAGTPAPLNSVTKDASWKVRGRHPSFLNCASNFAHGVSIVFERGVTLEAIDGTYDDPLDMLFRLENCENVTISGYGATFKMNTASFTNGESRHALAFYDCSHCLVEGLVVDGSGGDGLYVATRHDDGLSRNMTFRNIRSYRHRRQGASIISVDGLLIEHSLFADTGGTPPNAGIDIEPNHDTAFMSNTLIRHVEFTRNEYAGVAMYMTKFNGDTTPISVAFEDIAVHDNWHSATPPTTTSYARVAMQSSVAGGPTTGLRGSVSFTRAYLSECAYGGFMTRKHHDMYVLNFTDLVVDRVGLVDNGEDHRAIKLLRYNYGGPSPAMGNIFFRGVFVNEPRDLPFLEINSADGAPMQDFAFTNALVVSPNAVGVDDVDGTLDTPLTYTLTSTFPGVTLSMASADPVAVRGEAAAAVTVSRSGSVEAPLPVRYSLAGPARNYDDYDGLHGYLVIPAGESSADIPVRARSQPGADPTTVILSLQSAPQYTLAMTADTSVTVDIVNERGVTTAGPSSTSSPGDGVGSTTTQASGSPGSPGDGTTAPSPGAGDSASSGNSSADGSAVTVEVALIIGGAILLGCACVAVALYARGRPARASSSVHLADTGSRSRRASRRQSSKPIYT
jgi:hypothetical protein